MVAIRIKAPERRTDGFMLLARNGPVRVMQGEIYLCHERALKALDSHNIPYEEVPLSASRYGVKPLNPEPSTDS